jgi:NitT/TauT family transport system substrate-binding protein
LTALAAIAALATSTAARAETKIIVGYTATIDFVSFLIAKEEGFFAKRGLDVEPLAIPVNPNMPGALLSNSIQIATTTTPTFIQAVEGGLDLVTIGAVAVSDQRNTGVAIVARAGSGIAKPADLVGKKIAVPGIGALLDVLTRETLTRKGIDIKQVSFVEVGLPQIADVLKAGTVDAGAVGEPFTTRITGGGIGTVLLPLFPELPNGIPTAVFSAAGAWARQHPTEVKSFQEGIAEAVAFYDKDKEVARAVFGKYVKLPPEALAASGLPYLQENLDPQALSYLVDIMTRQGLLKTKIDLAAHIIQ